MIAAACDVGRTERDQGIVANLEFAAGKYGNNALLFKMRYAW